MKQALKKHDNEIAKLFEEIETKHGQKLRHLRHKAELQKTSPVQSPKSKQERWMWEIAAGDGRELDPAYKQMQQPTKVWNTRKHEGKHCCPGNPEKVKKYKQGIRTN